MHEKEQEFSLKSLFVPLTTFKALHIIVIVGFIVFGNMLFNGFVWDDVASILNNNNYHSITNIGFFLMDHTITYYRPIPAIVLTGIYSVFGPVAFWYHLFQLTFNIVNTILIFFIFSKFFSKLSSLILSLIFLVHPINVEAVSYISSLQIILSMFFALISLLLSLNQKIRPFYKYIALVVFILFSILSKETGIILILLPLFMYINFGQRFTSKNYVLILISLFTAAIFYFFLRFVITNAPLSDYGYSPTPIANIGLFERLINLPKILVFYLQTTIYPKDLAIAQNWLVGKITMQDFIIPLILDLAFFTCIGLGLIYYTKKQGKLFNLYFFFLSWFLLGWMIHWNIIPLDMTVAERWFYFALVGLLGMIGTILSEIKVKNQKVKLIVIGISIIIICLLSFRTIVRNRNWSDPMTLYEHDIKISTESFDLENNYAHELLLTHKYDEALPHILKSIKLAPKYWVNWNNLGSYYRSKAEIDKSISAFKVAINNKKNYYFAYFNLARVLFYNKSPVEAEPFLTKALNRFPQDPFLLYFKADTDYRLGNRQLAMDEILKAYEISRYAYFLNVYNQMQKNGEIEQIKIDY